MYAIIPTMKIFIAWLPQIVLAAGIWTAANGILHTVFVLAGEHGKHYNRELLRLLTDGLLLITTGTVILLCYSGLKTGQTNVQYIAIAACAGVIIYCFMIWPFLKSLGTLLIHIITLTALLAGIFNK